MRRVFALVLLAGCSDYEVSHSELYDDVESVEITLGPGESTEVMLRLEADAAAMAANPSNWLDLSIFAVRSDGSPVLTAAAGDEQVEVAIPGVDYLELVVDSPMVGCEDPSAEGLDATHEADGTCVVRVPVTLAVVDGTVGVQVTAHYELAFGSKDPPGAMAIRIVE